MDHAPFQPCRLGRETFRVRSLYCLMRSRWLAPDQAAEKKGRLRVGVVQAGRPHDETGGTPVLRLRHFSDSL